MTKYFIATLLAAGLAIAPASSYADSVEIEFVSPEMTKEKTEKKKNKKKKKSNQQSLSTLQYDSGWPLTIKLVMNDELGITLSDGIEPFFPSRTQTGFIVFSDPDDCLAMDSVSWWNNCFHPDTSIPLASDELFVEFTPGIDESGVPDDTGNADLQAKLVDSHSAGLSGVNASIGPETGEEVIDGYGKGADDDLPGLVVVAHHGPGIVWNDGAPIWPSSYSPKQPLELVNLAGYMNSVGYGLNDAKQRTFIMAQMIVPRGLFGPVVFYDTCYTSGAPKMTDESNCEAFWSIDGAAPEPLPDIGRNWIVTQSPRPQYREMFNATKITISAFVVSGTGPDRVIDMDENGEIDEHDLELMGYHVLGSKSSTTFNQIAGDDCVGSTRNSLVIADLDGNGFTGVTDACGSGSGRLTKVPR